MMPASFFVIKRLELPDIKPELFFPMHEIVAIFVLLGGTDRLDGGFRQ